MAVVERFALSVHNYRQPVRNRAGSVALFVILITADVVASSGLTWASLNVIMGIWKWSALGMETVHYKRRKHSVLFVQRLITEYGCILLLSNL